MLALIIERASGGGAARYVGDRADQARRIRGRVRRQWRRAARPRSVLGKCGACGGTAAARRVCKRRRWTRSDCLALRRGVWAQRRCPNARLGRRRPDVPRERGRALRAHGTRHCTRVPAHRDSTGTRGARAAERSANGGTATGAPRVRGHTASSGGTCTARGPRG